VTRESDVEIGRTVFLAKEIMAGSKCINPLKHVAQARDQSDQTIS
jgi:hypothetical protein